MPTSMLTCVTKGAAATVPNAVSYTHLDVYKRQVQGLGSLAQAVLPTLADGLLGVLAGAVVLGFVTLVQRLRGAR